MRTVAAVVHESGEPFQVQQIDVRGPGRGEVLVRMVASGICHTDLIARDGWLPLPLPVVLGHEGSGIVEQAGPDVDDLAPGDRVVLSFDSCGSCRACLGGRPAYCAEFFPRNFGCRGEGGSNPFRRDGEDVHGMFFGQSSFAAHAIVSRRSAVKVDSSLPLELLGPLGCGFQTGAGAVLNALRCRPGSSIAVFGSGSVGCGAVMAAGYAGCATVVVFGRNPARLAQARSVGATHAFALDDADSAGLSFDYTIEATGSPEVLRKAVDCLKPGGECGVVGVAAPGSEVALDMSALLSGRVVRGICEGDSVPREFIPTLLRMHGEGRFPFDKLITTYRLDQINEAIEDMHAGRVVKPVLTYEADR